MAPRIAVRAVAAVLIIVAVVACYQLPCANGGGVGVDGVMALMESCDDGTTLGECWARDELVRKPTTKYISYAALRADQIPCNKRGESYYQNCATMRQANPYTRGCSAITRCARNMN